MPLVATDASAIAAAAVLAGIVVLGAALLITSKDWGKSKGALGVGLLVGAVVAFAVGWAQFELDETLRDIERQRQASESRQALRLTIGLRQNLSGIDLSGRNLGGFYLSRKNFSGARFERTNLSRATLDAARFDRAQLTGVDLREATLHEASFREAFIGSVRTRQGRFAFTDFDGASLIGADFRNARFLGARLGGFLGGADFGGTYLRSVDFRPSAGIGQANFQGARYDMATKWPKGFDPRAAGARPAR
jgi:uncharacterized protein YjbI with pentapeptide repeats